MPAFILSLILIAQVHISPSQVRYTEPVWTGDEAPSYLVRKVRDAFMAENWTPDSTWSMDLTIDRQDRNYTVTMQIREGDDTILVKDAAECAGCSGSDVVNTVKKLRTSLLDRLSAMLARRREETLKRQEEARRLKEAERQHQLAEQARRKAEEQRRRAQELLKPRIIYRFTTPSGITPMPQWEAPEPPYRMWTWMAGATGALMLVTGVVLVAMDGSYPCDSSHARYTCEERYDTGAAGWGLVLGGLIFGGAAGWGYYTLYHQGHKKPW